MKKRLVALLTGTLIAVSVLSGCGESGQGGSTAEPAPAPAPEAEAEAANRRRKANRRQRKKVHPPKGPLAEIIQLPLWSRILRPRSGVIWYPARRKRRMSWVLR